MTNKAFKLLGLTLVVLMLVSTPISAAAPSPSVQGAAPFAEGEVLFQVKPGVSPSEIARTVGGSVLRSVGNSGIYLLKVKDGAVPTAVQALQGRQGVVFAEPNWLRQLHGPNDPGYGLKWDLDNDGTMCDDSGCAVEDADIDWEEAYNYLGGNFSGSAVVAVVDTGIDANHPDLNAKIVGGYDFLDDDPIPNDTYGHGTHVAGIALAETNNNTGTSGVAYSPNIMVMPLRVCDENGCPSDAVASAITWAADHGANVINLSLGGRFGSTAEQIAIDYAWSQGLVVAASSGNDGARKVSYPAAFTNCIAVGSTTWDDTLANYSNKGTALDVSAPGGEMSVIHDKEGIYSTMPTYDVFLTSAYGYSKNYDQLQGTSMAAPQVAGLAGLLFAVGVDDANGDGKFNDEIRGIIEGTVDDLGAAGWDTSFGWGRINVFSAVQAAVGGGGNQPPAASFTYSCTDLACTFDGSGSTDPDGSIVSYAWNFGDGGTANGVTASHTFGGDGTYTVTLTVTDNEDATDDDSKNVTVSSGGENQLPVASFTYSCTDLACTFDGSGSTDPDGSIVSYAWNFGDGGTASGATASHTFDGDGTYTVTLTVTDNEDATDDDAKNITVSSGGGGGTMHVAAIVMSYDPVNRNKGNIVTQVTIVDDADAPVADAVVTLEMTLPGGGTATGSGATLADGTVTFSLSIKVTATGDYVSTVTNVTHATLTYDSGANVEYFETYTHSTN